VSPALDALVLQALSVEPRARFETAEAMRLALQDTGACASHAHVGDWVRQLGGQLAGQPSAGASPGLQTARPSIATEVSPPPGESVGVEVAPHETTARRRLVQTAVVLGLAACAVSFAGVRRASARPSPESRQAVTQIAPTLAPDAPPPVAPPLASSAPAEAPRPSLPSFVPSANGRRTAITQRLAAPRRPDATILNALDRRE
jgi:hypothetical protein